jgi:23S rRNA pseudouridine1911/1915/1917 synthase
MMKVLYEDNHTIAVYKPAGVLSQADQTGDESIIDQVKAYLKEKYKKPGNVFLGLVQRLDRPVSGIILFAKTSKGASRLAEQFRNQEVEKTYHAIVVGKPAQDKGVLVNRLIKDEKLKKGRESEDGQEVKLYYGIVESAGAYSLLKIHIEGGKFHQIRSQLAIAGWPILGDVKYKAKEPLPDKSIALCATGLSFKQVVGDQIVHLSVEVPEEWQKYLSR